MLLKRPALLNKSNEAPPVGFGLVTVSVSGLGVGIGLGVGNQVLLLDGLVAASVLRM